MCQKNDILWHSGLAHLSYLQDFVTDLRRILASCIFHIRNIVCHVELCFLKHSDLMHLPYRRGFVIDLTH